MNKKTIKLTESEFKSFISQSIQNVITEMRNATNILKEDEERPEQTDTHFAIHKPSGKIVFSWDYSDIEPSELRDFKKDYFIYDIIDMEMNPKEITILTRNTCIKRGIDPLNIENWVSNYPMSENCGKKNITESSANQVSEVFEVDLYYVDFTSQELSDYFENNDIPHNSVDVKMVFETYPYNGGDYFTPPSGGNVDFIDCVVDCYGEFKKILPDELYQLFIDDVRRFVDENSEGFAEEIETTQEAPDYND